jgi:hypothetical protein
MSIGLLACVLGWLGVADGGLCYQSEFVDNFVETLELLEDTNVAVLDADDGLDLLIELRGRVQILFVTFTVVIHLLNLKVVNFPNVRLRLVSSKVHFFFSLLLQPPSQVLSVLHVLLHVAFQVLLDDL